MKRSQNLSLLETLQDLSADIKAPTTYLEGRTPKGEMFLPKSILCFSRTQSGMLLGSHSLHHHHRFVLIISLSGSGYICADDESFFISESQAVLIFPYQFHAYMGIRTDAINWLFITFSMENAIMLTALRNSPSRILTEFDLELLRLFLQNWQGGKVEDAGCLQMYLATLLTRLPGLRKNRPHSRKETQPQGGDWDLLLRINALVADALQKGNAIQIKGIAVQLGQSESHLRMRFRQMTGTSLGHHLRDLRLRRASELLRDHRLSVSEVGEQSGFDSVYSFSRAFKNFWKISPMEYRKRF